MTGCLIRGDGESRIVITGRDGTMYLLKSTSVALKNHLGHKVALTGTVKEIDDEEEGDEEYREGGAKLLIVTGLKMISNKCE